MIDLVFLEEMNKLKNFKQISLFFFSFLLYSYSFLLSIRQQKIPISSLILLFIYFYSLIYIWLISSLVYYYGYYGNQIFFFFSVCVCKYTDILYNYYYYYKWVMHFYFLIWKNIKRKLQLLQYIHITSFIYIYILIIILYNKKWHNYFEMNQFLLIIYLTYYI